MKATILKQIKTLTSNKVKINKAMARELPRQTKRNKKHRLDKLKRRKRKRKRKMSIIESAFF
jgi:hypothetical protein